MKQYIKEKIDMLTKDFKFKLSFEELESLKTAKSEMQVDRIAHTILMKKL